MIPDSFKGTMSFAEIVTRRSGGLLRMAVKKSLWVSVEAAPMISEPELRESDSMTGRGSVWDIKWEV